MGVPLRKTGHIRKVDITAEINMKHDLDFLIRIRFTDSADSGFEIIRKLSPLAPVFPVFRTFS